MSFTFQDKWVDILSVLTDEVRLEVLDAIVSYGVRGELNHLRPMAGKVFSYIKEDINEEMAKRASISSKRKAAALSRFHGKESKQKHANASISMQMHANACKSIENDANALKSMQMHEISSKCMTEKSFEKSLARVITKYNKHEDNNIIHEEKKESGEKEKQASQQKTSQDSQIVDVAKFVAFFNDTLSKANASIPHKCSVTMRRKKAIICRAKEHGKESLFTMVLKAKDSAFLNGENNRSWIATLDWLLLPNNFVKVIEGNYDNKRYGNKRTTDKRRSTEATKHSDDEF